MKYKVATSEDFNEILPLWEELWPKRKSIKPMSSITVNGQVDMGIYKKYKPTFWLAHVEGKNMACLSGHPTSEDLFRLRGLYVQKEYRNQGIAISLLKTGIFFAKQEKYKLVWTLPRIDSLSVYEKAGFYKCSPDLTENMLYGPNALAICSFFGCSVENKK